MHLEKRGKIVYAVDDDQAVPFRQLAPSDIKSLLVDVGPFGPYGEFFGYHRNTFILYLLQDAASRSEVIAMAETGDVAIYPRHRPMMGRGTIEMFWKNPNFKSLTKQLAGAIQYIVLDDKIVITHMSVPSKWRRNRLNTLMVEAIEQEHPGKPVEYEDPTEMGQKFMKSRGLGDAVLEMLDAGLARSEVYTRLRGAGLSGAEADAVAAFGELICA